MWNYFTSNKLIRCEFFLPNMLIKMCKYSTFLNVVHVGCSGVACVL